MLQKAAERMKNLISAFLIASPVTNSIVENLPDYPEFRDLTIRGLYPEAQRWPIRPIALRSLKWIIPATWNPGNGLHAKNENEIWMKRIDVDYKQVEITPLTQFENISGASEGKDTDDIWVDFVRGNQARGNLMGAFVEGGQDYIWPFSWDPASKYGMFTGEDCRDGK